MRLFLALTLLPTIMATTVHAQNLDLKRVGGSVSALDEGSQDPDPWWVDDPAEVGDLFADVTNSLEFDDGTVAATGITDGVATCNVATNSATPAASVGAADSCNTSCFSRETWGNVAIGNIWELWGVTSIATAELEVQPEPVDPSVENGVLEATLSILGTVTLNGTTAHRLEGGARCGNFWITYQEIAEGTTQGSTMTIHEASRGPIYSITGGSGANYILRTAEAVGVGSTFDLVASGRARSACAVAGIGAAGAIASVSTVGSCTVTGLSENDPVPEPSVGLKIGDDEEEGIPLPPIDPEEG